VILKLPVFFVVLRTKKTGFGARQMQGWVDGFYPYLCSPFPQVGLAHALLNTTGSPSNSGRSVTVTTE